MGLLTRAILNHPDKVAPFLLRERSHREPAQADAVYRDDLLREEANLENPQIFQICIYKNNFSAEYITPASFSAAAPQWASAGRRAAASAPWYMPA